MVIQMPEVERQHVPTNLQYQLVGCNNFNINYEPFSPEEVKIPCESPLNDNFRLIQQPEASSKAL